MSDFSSSRRKRTATERSESNADPLVIRKKAREAAIANASATQVSAGSTVSNNISDMMFLQMPARFITARLFTWMTMSMTIPWLV